MTLHVTIDPPQISGNRVTLSWSQDQPNPWQESNELTFSYPGLDLDRFDPRLFLEILIGTQLRIWTTISETIDLNLPLAMPRETIDFWAAYHTTAGLAASPLLSESSYSPWKHAADAVPPSGKVAVLFGGGRDSLTLATMLAEIVGPDQVLLVRGHDPLSRRPGRTDFTRERFEQLSLGPLRERGLQSVIYTNSYAANANKEDFSQIRAGYEKFTLISLPWLLASGAGISSLGLSWLEFFHQINKDGSVRPSRGIWRPENMAIYSRHLQRTLGFDHQSCIFSMLLTGDTGYRVLFDRYGDFAPLVLPCNRGKKADERWCYECGKCFHMARNSLANGVIVPDFDYNRMMKSTFLKSILEYARKHPPQDLSEPGPYIKEGSLEMVSRWHLIDFANVNYRVDTKLARRAMDQTAHWNLLEFLATYGNFHDDRQTVVPGEVIPRLPNPLAGQLANIASTVAPIVDKVASPFQIGTRSYHYDLAATFPHPLQQVPHVRSG